MKHKKTNAMRMLDRAKINYSVNTFEIGEEHLDGETIAELVHANVKDVYKTLVLENANHDHFVCVIPVSETLDLKEAAHVIGEKKLNLMPMDDLKSYWLYKRRVFSNRMKHSFPTIIDESALSRDKINVSGGQRGMQIILEPNDLIAVTQAQTARITQH